MKVIELGTDRRLLQALVDRQHAADEERSRKYPGLHLSTITQDIAKTLYPEKYAREFGDATKRMYFEYGLLIEDIIAAELRERIAGWVKPKPKQVDGIWCSPDGDSGAAIDELKAAWTSERGFVDSFKFHVYKLQVLGYQYAYKRDRGRIHVAFMNGDWRPPVPWPPQTYVLRPTQDEIEKHWRMLVRHAKDRRML